MLWPDARWPQDVGSLAVLARTEERQDYWPERRGPTALFVP